MFYIFLRNNPDTQEYPGLLQPGVQTNNLHAHGRLVHHVFQVNSNTWIWDITGVYSHCKNLFSFVILAFVATMA